MEGENFHIGNDFGWIWCRRSSDRTPEMDIHLRMRMKRIVLWLPRWGRGRGRNSILNLSPIMARSRTCPRWSVFIVTSMGISLLIVHKRRIKRRLLDLQLVRPFPRNLSLNFHWSHAWCPMHWDLCGIWIVVLPSTWWKIRNFLVTWRRNISRCI